MGNQVSSAANEDHFGIAAANKDTTTPKLEKKTKATIVSNEKKNSTDSGFFKDNISSYKGVKTDQSSASAHSLDKESTNEVTDTETGETNEPVQREQKVPTAFEWKEGGANVYLTGSFCNWNQKFLMNGAGMKFELTLVSNKHPISAKS